MDVQGRNKENNQHFFIIFSVTYTSEAKKDCKHRTKTLCACFVMLLGKLERREHIKSSCEYSRMLIWKKMMTRVDISKFYIPLASLNGLIVFSKPPSWFLVCKSCHATRSGQLVFKCLLQQQHRSFSDKPSCTLLCQFQLPYFLASSSFVYMCILPTDGFG